jgi:hypothetical protein
MAYYNHEHYKDPVEAAIFSKQNIDKWRVVKIAPEPEILRKPKKNKKALSESQLKLHLAAKARKIAKQNVNLKNHARKLAKLKISIGMIYDCLNEMYDGTVRQDFLHDAKEARDAIIENAEKMRTALLLTIFENGGGRVE